MAKYLTFFSIVLISSLWHMSLSALSQCDRVINGTQIIFSCNSTSTELNFYDLTASQLNSITSIVAKGRDNSTRGPFTFIPPNVCLLPNLQTVDFSYNQITDPDPTQSLSDCFTNIVTLNLQYNNISNFPSVLIYSMSSLKNLYCQGNRLSDVPVYAFMDISSLDVIDFSYNQFTSFELWALEVQKKADFSYNQISRITNKYFFTDFSPVRNHPSILLTNNAPAIEFTDGIYEMYGQCNNVRWALASDNTTILYFSWKLDLINFGTTQILCSCDQVYIRGVIEFDTGGIVPNDPTFSIGNATCSNSSISSPGQYFVSSDCLPYGVDKNSSVNFTSVYPRLCRIADSEGGSLTTVPNFTDPLPNISYPHYDSAVLNPGACFFSFTSRTVMTVVQCSNESASSSSKLPAAILDSSYLSNVNRITFPTLISSYPSYLCSLPSGEINLSGQGFTALTDATFPCLDSFRRVTLSNNAITTVSISNGNFQNLTYLDLSSNRLTQIPYSILTPSPTSLRILDLRNNSIGQIDLFVYTLQNITIYLDGNPITSTNLTNPQNATVTSNSTTSVNITYPGSVTNLSVIIQDSAVATLISCASFSAVQSTLNAIRASTNALLLCTCASYTLRQIYLQNGLNITQSFSCSNPAQLQSFLSLSNTSCPNAVYIPQSPCNNTETTTADPFFPPNGSPREEAPSRIGLIVGLVIGLIVAVILIACIVAAIVYLKNRRAAARKPKIARAELSVRGPKDTLNNRVQSRNIRSLRLPPIPSTSKAPLPDVPVKAIAPTTNGTLLRQPNSTVRTTAKGIPIRFDAVRSPNDILPQLPPDSNALTNSNSFRPINNVPTPQPRPNPMLNKGGDLRFEPARKQ